MEKRYFKNIDFLRFIFAVIIVILHTFFIACSDLNSFEDVQKIQAICPNMSFCVELFFIISGFFLILTYKNISVMQFLKNKFIRLSPVIIFTVILFLICSIFHITKFYFMDDIFSIFFLNGIQIVNHHSPYGGLGNVHSSWYVSVLVFVSLFYFYILKNYGLKLLNLLCLIFCTLGFHLLSYNINIFIEHSIIRGLSSIGLGIILGQLYLKYKDSLDTKVQGAFSKILLSIIECCVFGYLLYGIISKKSHLVLVDCIFLFVILFLLFIKRGGYLSRLLDNDWSVKLGACAYSIYITHCLWLDIFRKYIFTQDIAELHPKYISGGGACVF